MKKEKYFYQNLKPFLRCIDASVSKEVYQVMINKEYEMLVTNPVPENLADYYKSEAYISHTDSKKTLLDKVYQFVKNTTLKKKLKLVNSFRTTSKNILDVGAGTGDFLNVCQNDSWKVFGVEPSLVARKIAKGKDVFLTAELLQIENRKFDIITLWHVLEHVEKLSESILKLKELLSDEGRLIIAVPNYKSDDAKYYKEFWAAFDVPRHLWHFSQSAIQKIFSKEKMVVEKIIPMKFDAYYVSLLSEKYKTGKMNLMNALYRGFISNFKARTTTEYSSLIYVLKKY